MVCVCNLYVRFRCSINTGSRGSTIATELKVLRREDIATPHDPRSGDWDIGRLLSNSTCEVNEIDCTNSSGECRLWLHKCLLVFFQLSSRRTFSAKAKFINGYNVQNEL